MSLPLPGVVAVTLPARAEFVHIVRSVVADLAARHDLDLDAIEDLRLAVDEACAQLLRHAAGSALTIEVDPGIEEIEVRCGTDAHVDAWPPPGSEHGLAAQVLRGLADGVRWGRDEAGSPTIAVSKRRRIEEASR